MKVKKRRKRVLKLHFSIQSRLKIYGYIRNFQIERDIGKWRTKFENLNTE